MSDQICECEYVDVIEGAPPMKVYASPICPLHGPPCDCDGGSCFCAGHQPGCTCHIEWGNS